MSTEKKVWAIVAVFAALFAYGVYNVFQPDRPPMNFVRGGVREATQGVLVGPYPTEGEVERLRRMGVNVVISLMDADSPVESMLVSSGKKLAESYGMEYYDFPMSFVDIESPINIRQAEAAARKALSLKDKKIYAHCYLGRHRVGIFERELLRIKGQADGPAGSNGGPH